MTHMDWFFVVVAFLAGGAVTGLADGWWVRRREDRLRQEGWDDAMEDMADEHHSQRTRILDEPLPVLWGPEGQAMLDHDQQPHSDSGIHQQAPACAEDGWEPARTDQIAQWANQPKQLTWFEAGMLDLLTWGTDMIAEGEAYCRGEVTLPVSARLELEEALA